MGANAMYTRVGFTEAQAIEDVLEALLDAPDFARAVAATLQRGVEPGATAFERYAAHVLERAGGARLAVARCAGAFTVAPPENGRLAQVVHAGGIPRTLEPTVLSVECALNRLVCIGDALADGTTESEANEGAKAPQLRRSISILGGGYLAPNSGWRATRVKIPPTGANNRIDDAFYNEVDWRSADCVAAHARAVFQRCMRPNPYREVFDVKAGHLGDWDVRTRLAQMLGALELPHRHSFRFDYDASSHAVTAAFTCPPSAFLPEIPEDGVILPSALKAKAYETYLVRLTCLVAAACFGSGKQVERACVCGYNPRWSTVLVSGLFERSAFAKSVLAHVDAGDFSDPSDRFSPESVAHMARAEHLDWQGRLVQHRSAGVDARTIPMPARSVNVADDTRPLNQAGRALFHCERICDVDTSRYHGGHADAIDLARDDACESTLAAIMRLETLVSSLEDDASRNGPSRPLHADHPLTRLAVSLLDDERLISTQAEAYLGGRPQGTGGEGLSYRRAPSALYHARIGLSDLYQSIGDLAGAEQQANRCIELAPTTAGAYYRKADVLAERGNYAQAANVLVDGLACQAVPAECAQLYYHLGMLLWHMGKREQSCAVHVYNASLSGEHAARSAAVVEGLRKQGAMPGMAPATPFDAARELARAGLPVSPVKMRKQLVGAVMALSDSGSPRAAAPYALELERLFNHDEVIVAACRSIRCGVSLD